MKWKILFSSLFVVAWFVVSSTAKADTLGYTGIGLASSGCSPTSTTYASIFTALSSGTSTNAYLFASSSLSTSYQVMIYNVSGTTPTTLIANSNVIPTSTYNDTWITAPWTTPVQIVNGGTYALGFSGTNIATCYRITTMANGGATGATTFGSPANPFSFTTSTNLQYSMYTTYTNSTSSDSTGSSTITQYQGTVFTTIIADIETGTIIGLLLGFAIVVMRKNN